MGLAHTVRAMLFWDEIADPSPPAHTWEEKLPRNSWDYRLNWLDFPKTVLEISE